MMNPSRRLRAMALSGALALYATFVLPPPAWAEVIGDWNATAATVIVNKGAAGSVYLAFLHAPMYDAVNAIDGRYTVFAVKPASDPRGASKEAAAAAAAYKVLLSLWPDQQPVLDAALAASLAAIP